MNWSRSTPPKAPVSDFNEVATWVWHRLERPASFDQLRDGLLNQYEVGDEQCESELRALLDDLVERGLVARAPAGA